MTRIETAGYLFALTVLGLMAFLIVSTDWKAPDAPREAGTNMLSLRMFGEYGPAVVLIGLLLAAALIGGVCLGKEDRVKR